MEQGSSFWDTKTIVLTSLCFLFGSIALALIFFGTGLQHENFDINKHKELANVLVDQRLYIQAIEEYKKIENNLLSGKEKANINYIIANIYMENLKDFENALAYFNKSKLWGVDESLANEINRKIVASLENLGRSVDAQMELEQVTSLNKKEDSFETSNVIAKIGQKSITKKELDEEISKLPYQLQEVYKKDKTKKTEFLHQYIAKHLLYNASIRKGFDKDPGLIDKITDLKKELIIQRLLEDEFKKANPITEAELKTYYESNKDKFKEKDKLKKFEDVKQEIEIALQRKKQEETYKDLIERLAKAEEVKLFE